MAISLKRLCRYLERLALTLGLLIVLLLMGQAVLGPRYLTYRFTPAADSVTLEEVEAAIGARLDRFTIHKQAQTYTLGMGPMLMWAMPEGPPAYVFDASGSLIEFTSDLGDDQAFVEEWITGSDFDAGDWSLSDAIR